MCLTLNGDQAAALSRNFIEGYGDELDWIEISAPKGGEADVIDVLVKVKSDPEPEAWMVGPTGSVSK